jgi:flagellar basal-body rod modification protein FlgD
MSSVTSTGTYTNAGGTATNVNADGSVSSTSANASVSQDQFLQLLVTQLQNQDPDNPTDQTQMLAQLAQFSSLSEMQSLNTTMTTASQFSQLSQSAGLIGKTVTAGTTSDPVSGVVSSVAVQNGTTYLNIGGQDVDASTVTNIQ